jgi:LysM domain
LAGPPAAVTTSFNSYLMTTSVYWSCNITNSDLTSTTRSQPPSSSFPLTITESSSANVATAAPSSTSYTTLWTTSFIPSHASRALSSTISFYTAPSSTGCQPSPPAPTQPGASSNCCKWHVAVTNDTCDSVAAEYGINFDQLVALNPALDPICDDLWLGNA